jgi:hypothetical protein
VPILNQNESSFGADVAIELTSIERWLELEIGTTALFARHSPSIFRLIGSPPFISRRNTTVPGGIHSLGRLDSSDIRADSAAPAFGTASARAPLIALYMRIAAYLQKGVGKPSNVL